jgi:ADP-heptose:LPS heptosyltransferase
LKSKDPAALLPALPQGAEILVIRLRRLGDVVMLTPALAALHEWRPDLRLGVLVEPGVAAVLAGNPAVAETLEYRGFGSAVAMMRRRKFPVVFNQHGGPTSALLTLASGAPARVCWRYCQFPFCYNVLAPHPTENYFTDRKPHTVEHRITQLWFTGLPRGPVPPARVFPQPDAIAAVREKLRGRGAADSQPYAVVHPGATFYTRRWPVENYAQVARWLREEHGLLSVVAPGPGDTEILPAIREHFRPPAVVLEGANVREMIALVAGARLFVGNDTGPTHLASAAGCPVAVVFGSSDAATWGPWGTPHRIIESPSRCESCPRGRCYAFDESRCILSVSVEQVRDACAALLRTET